MVAGESISQMILPGIRTQISLAGIVAGDIVLTGGVTGEKIRPFKFTLRNSVPMQQP